ncbi:hypothetical protein ACP70R_008642 [Stipagrostis hirtigluma subsp. patula]
MAALWEIVGKASNLVQLLGLDAVTLIAMAMSFLWLHDRAEEECRKLEESVQMLRWLLRTPAGCWIMTEQQRELGELVTGALNDAHAVVESYNGSTLFSRLRRGRSVSRQLRDLHGRIDSYCSLIISVNAYHLIIVQANPIPSLFRTEMTNDGDVTPSTSGHSIDAETSPAALDDDAHIIIDVSQE